MRGRVGNQRNGEGERHIDDESREGRTGDLSGDRGMMVRGERVREWKRREGETDNKNENQLIKEMMKDKMKYGINGELEKDERTTNGIQE